MLDSVKAFHGFIDDVGRGSEMDLEHIYNIKIFQERASKFDACN